MVLIMYTFTARMLSAYKTDKIRNLKMRNNFYWTGVHQLRCNDPIIIFRKNVFWHFLIKWLISHIKELYHHKTEWVSPWIQNLKFIFIYLPWILTYNDNLLTWSDIVHTIRHWNKGYISGRIFFMKCLLCVCTY